MKHYREIDILRGIAIIMVFLGHAVIVYPINLENVAWCRGLVAFISAVHMPLFFIVAGFCFHRKSTYVDMVQKKIQRLLIPYTAFNMLPVSSDIFKVDSLCKYFIFFYAGFLIQIYFEIFPEWKKILDNTGVLIIGCLAWGMVFVAWYICKVTFIPQLCVSVIGIFVCVVFAIKICNIRPGLVLADIGKYSLQLYLLDGYFLGVSRTVLVQVLACTNPLVIVAGNTLFDLAGAFGTAKYVLMKAKVLRVLCGEK